MISSSFPTHKICILCGADRPASMFGIDPRGNGRLQSWCKQCKKEHATIKRRADGIGPKRGIKRDEHFKKVVGEASKRRWNDPEYKAKCSNSQKLRYTDPIERAKTGTRTRAALLLPENRKKLSESRKKSLASPENMEKLRRASSVRWSDPEQHLKQSERAKMLVGEKHPNWKGGISYEPYCPKFNRQLKESIRSAFDRRCFLCGAPEGKKHHCIHHVDYDKNDVCNGKAWPLIPLCASCHSITNHNRWYWFNLLINYWLENENIHFRGFNSCMNF